MPNKTDARIFNCARCLNQTTICNFCDRAQIYCGTACSEPARQESHRKADQRYQNTFRGKRNHAQRQKHYQVRQKEAEKIEVAKIMTDVTYAVLEVNALLPRELNTPIGSLAGQSTADEAKQPIGQVKQLTDEVRCDFCKRSCSKFLRLGFLRHRLEDEAKISPFWPSGP